MNKYVKYFKRIAALFIVVIMNVNAFATAAGNYDGTSIVTKAEFDTLMGMFNEKMDEYQTGLNAKIDQAVSKKKKKMSSVSTQNVTTGLDIVSNTSGLKFVKKDNNYFYMTNEPYTKDIMFNIAAGTYAKEAVYCQDCYDTLIFNGYKELGNANNLYYTLDSDGCVTGKYNGVKMIAERKYFFYSTTYAQNGLVWRGATQTLNTPTELYSASTAYVNGTTMTGFAYSRSSSSSGPGSPWTHKNDMQVRYQNKYSAASHSKSDYTSTNQNMWDTTSITFTLSNVLQQTVVSITGSKLTSHIDHWQLGSDNTIKTTTKEWGSKDLIKAASTSRSNYTTDKDLRATAGPACYRVSTLSPTISGYGLKFDYTAKAPTAIYYKEIYDAWGKKCAYAGGFPFLYNDLDGKVTVTLQINTAATIAFTTSQSTTFPAEGDSRLVEFEYQPSGSQFITTNKPVLLGSGTYKFRVPVFNKNVIYLNGDWATTENYLIVKQIGTAKIEFDQTV